MILLQLSSGRGPIESCQAIGLALNSIAKQCRENGVELEIIDTVNAAEKGCYKSVLLQLVSKANQAAVKALAMDWQGTMLWIGQSQFRPKHKRKNWFFSGTVFDVDEQKFDQQVRFQTCRASGAGGQHVNTTDSAVRATHVATGVSVRVESERSQHANKRVAIALLFQKLEQQKSELQSEQDKARWQQHWSLERGNPVKTFKGDKFREL